MSSTKIQAIFTGGPIDGKPNIVDDEERADYYRAGGNAHDVAHRQGLGGNDEGLTFDITTIGSEDEGKRILRFDCFYKNPHYHIGASGGEQAAYKMKDEGIADPVRWTLEQLKTRFPAMVKQARYEEIANTIDQRVARRSSHPAGSGK